MINNKIAVVVVTYNRLELLKQVVSGLLNQTLQPNKIIIVNNSSTDGTTEWLDALANEYAHITIIKQENIGSSGGQYTGTKAAYEMGYEWIWIMDDDVVATPDCLQNLMQFCKPDLVCHPLRISYDGEIFVGTDTAEINLTNPFKGLHKRILTKSDYTKTATIPVDVVTFEGPIFHYSMFEKVGFPDKKFFIYGDDTEFSIRLGKAGIRLEIITNAILNRLLPFEVMDFDNWKFYYIYRNMTAIDTLYGSISVRLFRSFFRVLTRIFRCKNLSQIKTLLRAFYDGYFYKQEKEKLNN